MLSLRKTDINSAVKPDKLNQISLLVIISLLISFPAHAETELIPFSGYRIHGEFEDLNSGITLDTDDENTYGLIINIDYEPDTQLEFIYSRQSTALKTGSIVPSNLLFDLDVDYYHIGGLVLYPVNERTHSFVGGGIGITHFSPDYSGYSSESEFSMSLSGGVKYSITDQFGLRLGIRLYGTWVDDDSAIFCRQGTCAIYFNGSLYTQYEANAGVVFRF